MCLFFVKWNKTRNKKTKETELYKYMMIEQHAIK